MDKQYIFTKTHSGDKTNIMSSFPLWDINMFLKEVSDKKGWRERFRYGYIGGTMELLKDMRLEEFEQVFSGHNFTPEQITELFRKEISEKYGKHKELKEIVPLKKKDLVRGGVYLDLNNNRVLYLGNIEREEFNTKNNTKNIKIGNGFSYLYDTLPFDIIRNSIDIVSGIRKLKEYTGEVMELEKEYNFQSNSWYYGIIKTKFTLL